jgi:hypothetical protein
VGLVAPIIVSIIAIGISLWVAIEQLKIQKRQLKKDLFDRRFVVYTDTRDFLNYVGQMDGRIILQGPEYHHFLESVEKAEMLFPATVHQYLKEIVMQAGELYAYRFKEAKAISTGDQDELDRGAALTKLLYVTLPSQRNQVFRPYIKMD